MGRAKASQQEGSVKHLALVKSDDRWENGEWISLCFMRDICDDMTNGRTKDMRPYSSTGDKNDNEV